MMPIKHPWEEWQKEGEKLYSWEWKENTPKEIKKQYEDWKKYCNKHNTY